VKSNLAQKNEKWVGSLLANFFLVGADLAAAAPVAEVGGAGLAVPAGLVLVVAEAVAVPGQALAREAAKLKTDEFCFAQIFKTFSSFKSNLVAWSSKGIMGRVIESCRV
jgi:hypothetical protein